MDAYPTEYINHDAPLILLSGLGDPEKLSQPASYPSLDEGIHIQSNIPPLAYPEANQLLDIFLDTDKTGPWPQRIEKSVKGSVAPFFRIKAVGRNYTFPPRKANLQNLPPPTDTNPDTPPRVAHSPISPLSPNSPLYPDGVMSHLWVRKHSELIPSVFISVYELPTDSNNPKQYNTQDNQIIGSINHLKRFLSTGASLVVSGGNEPTSRRTTLAVVLLSKRSFLECPSLDERVANIKKMTGLDLNKTFFFLPAHSSPVEMIAFVKATQLALLPACLEYYRELSKHTRRKKNRGTVPPPTVAPTGASHLLSNIGWNVRYEFKLGVFAEFRQEMDIASKCYETAYENLINEIFMVTNHWNTRWNEARILSDILAFRIVRCAIWIGSWTVAVKRWDAHIDRVRTLLDTKGNGSTTYGFSAWLCNWNKALAGLVKSANLPMFIPPPINGTQGNLTAPFPEVTIVAPLEYMPTPKEKHLPQHRLHHPGYYYLQAAKYAAQRQARARLIPENTNHDSYLCLEPAEEASFDHSKYEEDLLRLALAEFEARGQARTVSSIQYQIACLQMTKAQQTADSDVWRDAGRLFATVARQYRKDRWPTVLQDVLTRRLHCATEAGDLNGILAAQLELLEKRFNRPDGDLMNCLHGLSKGGEKTTLVLRAGDFVDFLNVSFVFEKGEAHVGDFASSQITVKSTASPNAKPIRISEIKLTFEGNYRMMVIRDSTVTESSEKMVKNGNLSYVNLGGQTADHDSSNSPLMSPSHQRTYSSSLTDLSLCSGESKVFELATVLREAGEVRSVSATLCIVTENFDLELIYELEPDEYRVSEELEIGSNIGIGSRKSIRTGFEMTPDGGNGVWHAIVDGKILRKPIRTTDPNTLRILPKPPKIKLLPETLPIPAYLGEIIKVPFDIRNDEDEPAVVSLVATISGVEQEIGILWLADEDNEEDSNLPTNKLGQLMPGQTARKIVQFTAPLYPADCTIDICAQYYLISDPETPVSKAVALDLPIVDPFAATFDFSPRVHPEEWPSYFTLNAEETAVIGKDRLEGLWQRWCLTANLTNQATETLIIKSCTVALSTIYPDNAAVSTVSQGNEDQAEREVLSSTSFKSPFMLDIRRRVLEDRRALGLDASLNLEWKRVGSAVVNKTVIAVPRLPVPASEPRVLCTSSKNPSTPFTTSIHYHIENPTTYFLAFTLTMDSSDSFAFSGQKQTMLHVLPMSRAKLTYSVLPTGDKDVEAGRWINPHLKVLDSYFMKTLRVSPADDDGRVKLVPASTGVGVEVWTGIDGPNGKV